MASVEAAHAPAATASAGPSQLQRERRLIINADDFGRSHEINEAVIRAHTEGVLTTASLMVNEAGFEEAVALARRNPRLGVGLHLSLVCGRSALPPARIPNLVDRAGRFPECPVAAGLRYFFRRSCREQLAAEIASQFERFHSTGLVLDHVNGHLHFHLHPTVFAILLQHAREWGIQHMRWTRDPFWFNAGLARGRWAYRVAHATVFNVLSRVARSHLRRMGIAHTRRVFGLLQDGHVDEQYITRLISELPPGDSELYSHPSPSQFRHELDALVSKRVRDLIAHERIALIRYQDL